MDTLEGIYTIKYSHAINECITHDILCENAVYLFEMDVYFWTSQRRS